MVYRKPLPLTTVDLQKAGSRILKISPKKVLDVCMRSLHTTNSLIHSKLHRLRSGFTSKGFCHIRVLKQTSMIHSSTSCRLLPNRLGMELGVSLRLGKLLDFH